MTRQPDIERVPDIREPARSFDILVARMRISARMIVDEQNCGGIEFERAAEDDPGIERQMREATALQAFIGNEVPRPIEEQDTQMLVGERPHGCDEIVSEFRIVRIDPPRMELAAHRCEHRAPGAEEELDHRCVVAENAGQGFGRLGPDPLEAVKLLEERACYVFAVVRRNRSDELCQDG